MTNIKASTQEHLDIEDIRDNLVIRKDGSAVAVLRTTAVNFDLLSEREQEATIEAYASLLNSLSFTIQVLVRSKRLKIESYINKLRKEKEERKNEKLKKQMANYINFITNLTKKNEVLDKKFYLAVPYQNVQIKIENPLQKFLAKLQGRELKIQIDVERTVEKAIPKLEPRIEQIRKQFNRVGIRVERLNTEQLVKLFYDFCN